MIEADDGDGDESETDSQNIAQNGSTSAQKSGGCVTLSSEPQPGPSSGIRHSNGSSETDNEEAEANENLQFAWESLEMAAKIFRRLGENHHEYLAEAHYGLGEILMENQNCSEAIRDYSEYNFICNSRQPIQF